MHSGELKHAFVDVARSDDRSLNGNAIEHEADYSVLVVLIADRLEHMGRAYGMGSRNCLGRWTSDGLLSSTP